MQYPAERVYHYTNFQALKSILDTKQLWLSHWKCLNDAHEFIQAKKQFSKWIMEETKQYLELNSSAYREMDRRISGPLLKYESDQIFDLILKALEITGAGYIFNTCIHSSSFPESNGLLSMWRGYGDKGGYAIGFNKQKLENFFHETSSHEAIPRTSICGQVYYSEECYLPCALDEEQRDRKHSEIIKGCLSKIISPIFEPTAKKDDLTPQEVKSILEIISRWKHPGFSEETEYRCTIFDNSAAFDLRQNKGQVVQYIKLDILLNIIEEIIVGPQPDIDKKVGFLKDFVKQRNLNIKIIKSEVPYIHF